MQLVYLTSHSTYGLVRKRRKHEGSTSSRRDKSKTPKTYAASMCQKLHSTLNHSVGTLICRVFKTFKNAIFY